MKVVLKILVGLLIFLLIAGAVSVYLLNQRKPITTGELPVPGLEAPVDVHFDAFGIPHLYASNMADAYRAFGYVHAQDRLFQMELMRRVGHGRLAEVLGPDLAKTDAFFRTIGTHRQAMQDAAAFHTLPQEVQVLVHAYLAGVNAYIDREKLPIEFGLARIKPSHYEVADVYAIAAYMAYSFAYALRTDPLVDFMYTQLDSSYLADFNLAYQAPGAAMSGSAMSHTVDGMGSKPAMPGFSFLDQLPVPSLQGSNAWAIAPSRSASGHAMLANDTHIKYGSPSVWYEAHIHYPGFEIYGNFLAGIPLALVGHNRSQAWGITMFEDDDSDFFIQRFASADSVSTLFGGSQTRPVRKYRECIAVKGRADTCFTVYETENGPIINAFLPEPHAEAVAMYWNYTCVENELVQAFYTMNHAGSMAEFKAGVAGIASPGLNVTYADTAGNIASWACSRLIERAPHTQGKAYMRGYAPEDAYLGYHAFANNPQVENPPSGYIASANQHHDASEGLSYPGYYAPYNRYDRISSMIEQVPQASLDDMKRWITDVTSPLEASVAHDLCAIVQAVDTEWTELESQALSTVCAWDGGHQLEATGPALYYLWMYHVLYLALADELGDAYFETLLSTHLLPRSYPGLIGNPDSPWWTRASAPEQDRADVVLHAFRKSVVTLASKLGPDPATWHWERVHSTEHEHPLGQVAALRPYFNVGPFPSPGGKETVNNAGFRFNADAEYHASYGPAMRILIDMAEVDNALSVLPTGNSGNVLSPHYKDQAELYIRGDFRPMLMDDGAIKGAKKLVLTP
jgi:penicillin G amidase